jgi:hypothetical protein
MAKSIPTLNEIETDKLQKELDGLKVACLTPTGKPKKSATPQELARILELRKQLGETLDANEILEQDKSDLDPAEELALEKALRKYVKRKGGFRFGISDTDKALAERIMKSLGRTEPKWDGNIYPEIVSISQITKSKKEKAMK